MGKALLQQPAEQALGCLALGHRVEGQVRAAKVKIHPAALGNFLRALHRIAQIGEQRAHLGLAFDVQLLGLHAHALHIVQRFAGLDAHQHLLGGGILPGQIMAVVGCHQWDAGLGGQSHQARQGHLFLADAMVHHLDKVVALAHDVLHHQGVRLRLIVAAIQQQAGQFARQAGAQRDKPLVVLAQQVIVDARLVIKPAGKALAHQLHEVLIALVVLAQQNQVAVLARHGLLFCHIRADVHLAADDRVDALAQARLVEVHHTIHCPMVGDGAGIHAHPLDLFDQVADAARAVQKAIFAVNVKMDKHFTRFPPA